jgi:hypothetical protein
MEDGFARRLVRNHSVNPNDLDGYCGQLEAFRAKFGRDMGPDDPFFFDPLADTPQFQAPEQVDQAIGFLAELMGDAGVDPAAIFAFKKTGGLLPTETTHLRPDEMEEWSAAVDEYHALLRRSATQ